MTTKRAVAGVVAALVLTLPGCDEGAPERVPPTEDQAPQEQAPDAPGEDVDLNETPTDDE